MHFKSKSFKDIKRFFFSILIAVLCYTAGFSRSISADSLVSIIPQPNSVEFLHGSFKLVDGFNVYSSSESSINAKQFINEVKQLTGLQLQYQLLTKPYPKTGIVIIDSKTNTEESYELNIHAGGITVIGGDKGVFYGLKSVLQLATVSKQEQKGIPCMNIKDKPRFKWRGMHLDVSRHFFSVGFVKKYIDLLAFYKFNTFHWHLTDDQGWRIEIKKYPGLTSKGAWRNGSMIGHYSDHKFDTVRYGGFYTQAQIKEVVDYATKRNITVVPEIEMPGHSVAALTAYPQYSCSGGPFEVMKEWGVSDDVLCAGNDSTFIFINNILEEVIALFPSKYIHIGGDECPKVRWKRCPKCQDRIKALNLKDEHHQQSYFIVRVEKFLNSKGKQIIGWDEILEGGLAPNAAVMSWRGYEGGIEAAKQKHNVVMTPGSHCYFDHYQGYPRYEPTAIGGYTTLKKVYEFEPVPAELSKEESEYILGAQGNVWAEYLNDSTHVEYMVMPRMMALSEVLWTQNINKNWTHFHNTFLKNIPILDKKQVNYSLSSLNVDFKIKVDSINNQLQLSLSNESGLSNISYSINNGAFRKYDNEQPLIIKESQNITAKLDAGSIKTKPITWQYEVNKATAKPISLKFPSSRSYQGEGEYTLVNGVEAQIPKINKEWLGWSGENMVATIDLLEKQSITKVKVGFLNDNTNWIYIPKELKVYTSDDGLNFTLAKSLALTAQEDKKVNIDLSFQTISARYVKVEAVCADKIKEGMHGAGEDPWLMVDEISIY